MTISDPAFDQNISLREAFFVLIEFLEQFNSRGPMGTDDLASWLQMNPDGNTGDPAQLDDFLQSALSVIGRRI